MKLLHIIVVAMLAAVTSAVAIDQTMIITNSAGKSEHVALLSKTATHVKVRRACDDAVFDVRLADLEPGDQQYIAEWTPSSAYVSQPVVVRARPARPSNSAVFGASEMAVQGPCRGGRCKR